jgi:ribosome biogenesis GTPase
MHSDTSGLGRVLAQHRGRWLVASDDEEEEPRLLPARGSLRGTPPVTGDRVAIDPGGAISAVLARRGTLVRRAAGDPTAAQVLAANIDLALVVESLPEPNERRTERLAALALAGGVPAAIVLTKSDLVDDGQAVAARMARHLGLADGVAVSARDGSGLGILRKLLVPGETAALIGRSGAGKSTLVNALLGEDRQATRPVREGDGRGRHTTVTRELIALPGGRWSSTRPACGRSASGTGPATRSPTSTRWRLAAASPTAGTTQNRAARPAASWTPSGWPPGGRWNGSRLGWRTGRPPPGPARRAPGLCRDGPGRRSGTSAGVHAVDVPRPRWLGKPESLNRAFHARRVGPTPLSHS